MPLLNRWLLFFAAAVLVAACAGPVVPDLGLTKIEGTVYDFPEATEPPVVLSVGMLLVDDTVFSMTTSGFFELDDGVWVGAFTGVVDDGYVIVPPGEEDLPDGVLAPADEALLNAVALECDLDIEPAGVQLTITALQFLAVPSLVGLTPDGLAFMITTDGPVAEGDDFEDVTFVSWIFADAPVEIATGDDCADLVVDLSLRQGWNQVSWSFDEGTLNLLDGADADPFSGAVFGL